MLPKCLGQDYIKSWPSKIDDETGALFDMKNLRGEWRSIELSVDEVILHGDQENDEVILHGDEENPISKVLLNDKSSQQCP